MNFVQKYKIIYNIHNTTTAPVISHNATSEIYHMETKPYKIKAAVQLPHYDGERTGYTIMVANNKNNELIHAERDTFFAKLVTKILERKYYSTGRVK